MQTLCCAPAVSAVPGGGAEMLGKPSLLLAESACKLASGLPVQTEINKNHVQTCTNYQLGGNGGVLQHVLSLGDAAVRSTAYFSKAGINMYVNFFYMFYFILLFSLLYLVVRLCFVLVLCEFSKFPRPS